MADADTRADLEMRLEFDTVYLANGLDALSQLVEGCAGGLPSPENLGHLIKHSARYAEEVRELTIKLVTMKP